jgi:SAM-dependent methyltransferase
MSDTLKESYEQIPYDSTPRHQTLPDTLAVVAILLGLSPPPVEHCRVLELGCATGGNILPMALAFPNAHFTGIDLSPRQIEIASAVARASGAANIQFLPKSITDITPDFGQFDYILCHGVYTWVPIPVRDKILDICRDNLSPQGVAYLSYNTYPGWHGRGMIREMMRFHTRHSPDSLAQVAQGRQFLELLGQYAIKTDAGYNGIINEELDLIRKEQDYYIAHEYFEDSNSPLYFHEFAAQLAQHDLQFLGESPLSGGAFGQLAATLRPFLKNFPNNPLDQEQYFDFARNRTFRRSLVIHSNLPLHAPSAEAINNLHVEGLARADSPDARLYDTSEERFHISDGVSMTANNPIVKTTLKTLHELWPGSIPFPELQQRIAARLAEHNVPYQSQPLEEHLAPLLLHCYLGAIVDLHTVPPRFTTRTSERPCAFSLARLQAAQANNVSNLRHRTVALSDFDRLLLPRLDGEAARPDLIHFLDEQRCQGAFSLDDNGQPLSDPAQITATLENSLADALHRLALSALLLS